MKSSLIMSEDEDQNIIEHYRLLTHPEGGWFRRTFSSSTNILLDRGERLCGSSIYYFLKQGEHSCLHSLKSDEIWYFHFGSSVRIHLFSTSEYHSVDLGHDWQCGEVAQYSIPAGVVLFLSRAIGDPHKHTKSIHRDNAGPENICALFG